MFTTMCPKEQQTLVNLIVKDCCFIIEIFDKFSFSGILRGMFKVTGLGTLTPVINQLKLDIAWREMLSSCHKQTV